MPRPKSVGSKSELVRLAIAGIDAEIEKLMVQRAEIARMAPGAVDAPPLKRGPGRPKKSASVVSAVSAPAKRKRKRRKVSEETKRKLKIAAQARWARVRGK